MYKRWIVFLGAVLVGLAVGCREEGKVIKPDKVEPPAGADEDIPDTGSSPMSLPSSEKPGG